MYGDKEANIDWDQGIRTSIYVLFESLYIRTICGNTLQILREIVYLEDIEMIYYAK